MIVDCHTHLGVAPGDTTEAEQAHERACAGLDAALVLERRGKDRAGARKQLVRYLQSRAPMHGLAAINPTEDKIGVRGLTGLRDEGFRGVVLYCCEDGFHPTHSRAMRLYESAAEMQLPVFFHNGGPFATGAMIEYAQPFLLDEVARRFPTLKIIIGRMGLPFVPQTLALLAKHPNVYADLTIRPRRVWEVYNLVVNASEAGVMNKLLFGSGFPDNDPGHCMETLLGFNRLLADTKLPTVPREQLRGIIERDTLAELGLS